MIDWWSERPGEMEMEMEIRVDVEPRGSPS
jgi:hypothetical protein